MQQPPVSLHSHRLDNNASKLPTFRHVDLNLNAATKSAVPGPLAGLALLWPSSETVAPYSPSDPKNDEIAQKKHVINKKVHVRNYSETAVQEHFANQESSPAPAPAQEKPRPVTSSGPVESRTVSNNIPGTSASTTTQPIILTTAKARKDPARDSRGKHLPLAMLNGPQKYSPTVTVENENNNPTEDWVANQSVLTTSPLDDRKSQPLQSPLSQPVTPSIPPIRGFKSSRKGIDAQLSRTTMDQDETVRGSLDGFNSRRPLNRDQEEQSSDDSDLFLKLARDESAGNNRSGVVRRVSIAFYNAGPNHSPVFTCNFKLIPSAVPNVC